MSTDKEMSSDVQPEKKWRMFGRRQKLSNCESRAAPQEGEEHRDCRAASVARAAAAGSRAAPHSPRGRGQALLRSLRRGCRAIVSGMAAVIRRRGQQPGTRRPLRRGTGTGTAAAAAPALGPERRAAAPHSPCCPPSPEPGQLEALGGQGAGAAAGAALRQPEVEEQASSTADWEVDSPKELSEEEEGRGPSPSSEEERPPLRPREAWAEHGELQPCTGTGQAPALPSRAPHRGEEASNPDPLKDQCPPSPSLSQLGDIPRQGTGAEAEPCPSEAPAEEGSSSDELRSVCSLPGLGTAWAEISHLSWSSEEESSSGSFPGKAWPEDEERRVHRQQRWSSEEERPPRPPTAQAWEELMKLEACTEQSPAEPCRRRQKKTKTSGPKPSECCRTARPSPCQLEELGQWAGPEAMGLLEELRSEERRWSLDGQASSEESHSESSSYESNELESPSGPGQLLKLFLQDTDQSVSSGEDNEAQEPWQRKREDIIINTIWVNPLCPALMVEPCSLLPGEADTAEAAEAAKPAASAAPGAQAAAAESWAVAPHSPCCPRSPSPGQPADLGQWAGSAGQRHSGSLLAVLQGEEGSSSNKLRSVCSLPGLGTAWAEISHLSWSTEESSSGSLLGGSWAKDTKVTQRTGEESGSGSLPFEAWAEDTDLSGSTDEDSGSVSLPSDLWSQSSDPAWRPEDESSSGSLPWDSPDGTWGQQLLEWDRQSFERLKRLCPPVAVPERRPSHFRRALRALRRAFGSLGRFNAVLQP